MMKNALVCETALLLALVLSTAAQTNLTKPAANEQKTTVPATSDDGYVVGPQDALTINVWKEPEISGSVVVRPDGKISIPLLNDVQAAGLTPLQLTAQLTEALRKYIANPQVTVIVTAINSQRVYVLGQVSRAGAMPLLPEMTVLQAISSAGGISQYGNGSKIYILRTEGGKQKKLPFNYKEVIKGQKPEQNFVLKPGDTIIVP